MIVTIIMNRILMLHLCFTYDIVFIITYWNTIFRMFEVVDWMDSNEFQWRVQFVGILHCIYSSLYILLFYGQEVGYCKSDFCTKLIMTISGILFIISYWMVFWMFNVHLPLDWMVIVQLYYWNTICWMFDVWSCFIDYWMFHGFQCTKIPI